MNHFFSQEEFQKACPQGRLLAMDVGTKQIGMAISDPGRHIAQPWGTFKRDKWAKDGPRLAEKIQNSYATGLIIGWPLHMDGHPGSRCHATLAFSKNLWEFLPYPTLFWDERLSTQSALKTLMQADLKRAKKSQIIDQVAACHILHGVLSSLRFFQRNL